jgi:hypothetical protein
MNWKNIETEKPKSSKQILVLIDSRVASVAKYNGESFTDDGLEIEDVTH